MELWLCLAAWLHRHDTTTPHLTTRSNHHIDHLKAPPPPPCKAPPEGPQRRSARPCLGGAELGPFRQGAQQEEVAEVVLDPWDPPRHAETIRNAMVVVWLMKG